MPTDPAHPATTRAVSPPGRLSWAELRLTVSAPRPYDGFTSTWVRVPVGGLRLHVRRRVWPAAGPEYVAAGPEYVMVHGLAVSHRYLTPTAAWLRRPVSIPDLPGFGLSDKPPRRFGVADHATVLACWLDGRGRGPVCLIANSYGCQVAVELAVRRPDLVAALILSGPTGDPAAASVPRQLGRWVRDLWWEDWRQAPILVRDVLDAGVRRVAGTLRESVRDRIGDRLPLVAAATLLVRGARDPICPASWMAAAARLLPHVATVEIPGAAHAVATTAGRQVALVADRFIDRTGDDRLH